ncbi:hypothetical protein ARMSODRAFT_223913 [Armillaria solidipes]|uniref:Uncharacterized protein n=1 Tax=Armillaria solidipes TaxID=1076256 RepID=A0A2H3CM40_9AGAR|nr:hypothetical protein ARMSODRAFT_223913 [Armillaria solidipes]
MARCISINPRLYCCYITIFKFSFTGPLSRLRATASVSPFLAISTNATRSCSHIEELQIRRNGGYFPSVSGLLSFNAGIVLISIWSARHSGLAIDVDKEMGDVHKCMRVLANLEMRYQNADVLWDILYELASASDLRFRFLATKSPPSPLNLQVLRLDAVRRASAAVLHYR